MVTPPSPPPRSLPHTQVVITASDDARLNSVGLVHVDRRSSIRRVTVGGVSGSSIVFA